MLDVNMLQNIMIFLLQISYIFVVYWVRWHEKPDISLFFSSGRL